MSKYTYKVYIHNILIKNGLKIFKSLDTVKRALLTFINSEAFRILVDKIMLRYNNPNQFVGGEKVHREQSDKLLVGGRIGLQDPNLLIDKLLVSACILENDNNIEYLKDLIFRPNEHIGSDGIKRDYIKMSDDEMNKLNIGGLDKKVTNTDFVVDILKVVDKLDKPNLKRLKLLIDYEEQRKTYNMKRGSEYKKIKGLLERQYDDYKNEALLDDRIKKIAKQLGIKEVDKNCLNVIKYYYHPKYEYQNSFI